jgi:ECF transporter S component (folate family)
MRNKPGPEGRAEKKFKSAAPDSAAGNRPGARNLTSPPSLRTFAQVAVIVALEIAMNRFLSINTDNLKIGFSFLPIALCGMVLGPVPAACAWALADFLGAMLFPIGPYFPGFTLCAALSGAVFGLFLYGKDSLRFFPDVLPPTLINCLVFGLVINSFWLSLLYGSDYWFLVTLRLGTQYVFLIPVYLVSLPLLSRLAAAVKKAGLAPS